MCICIYLHNILPYATPFVKGEDVKWIDFQHSESSVSRLTELFSGEGTGRNIVFQIKPKNKAEHSSLSNSFLFTQIHHNFLHQSWYLVLCSEKRKERKTETFSSPWIITHILIRVALGCKSFIFDFGLHLICNRSINWNLQLSILLWNLYMKCFAQ